MTGVKFEIGVNLLKDYRGERFEDYANHFVLTLGKGQFTSAVAKLSPVERMKRMPASYSQLKDNPLRSTFEVVFTRLGIKGGLMRDYLEFRASQRLLDRGLLDKLKEKGMVAADARVVPGELATDPRLVKLVEKRLGKRSMKKFLLSNAVDKSAKKELRELLGAL